MRFELQIEMGNDAFADDPARAIAEMLYTVASTVRVMSPGEMLDAYAKLRDHNGNMCGHFEFKRSGK